MFEHQDVLAKLNDQSALPEKLCFIHDTLKQRFSFIDRIAIATYDRDTDLLKTFLSTGPQHVLVHYEAALSKSPSLQDILAVGRPRVVNNLDIFADSRHEHSKRIADQGFHSSYTMPMYMNGRFLGFIFFNSRQNDVFSQEALHYLDLFGHMISLLIANELSTIRTLMSTLQAARHVSNFRDSETGMHMDRMAHYSRLIAQELAGRYQLSDDFIEHVFLFSPLHDIGKIGVPDAILNKPSKLTAEEYGIMKRHAAIGREIIDRIMHDADLDAFPHLDILRNIAEYHHEAIDGHGYPRGLQHEEIPIEARIIAVADVFDALTSKRPYKECWSIDDAFAMLERLANHQLDPVCVQALIRKREAIEEIQRNFDEDHYG